MIFMNKLLIILIILILSSTPCFAQPDVSYTTGGSSSHPGSGSGGNPFNDIIGGASGPGQPSEAQIAYQNVDAQIKEQRELAAVNTKKVNAIRDAAERPQEFHGTTTEDAVNRSIEQEMAAEASNRKVIDVNAIPDPDDASLPYQTVSPNGEFRDELKRLYKDLYKINPPYTKHKNARALGLLSVQEADLRYSLNESEEAIFWKDLGGELLDIAIGLNPTTGFAQSFYELVIGKSLVTGAEIGAAGRSFAFLGVVTLGGSKSIGVASRAMTRVYQGAAAILHDRQAIEVAVREGNVLVTKVGRVLNEWGKGHKITHIEEAAGANLRSSGKPPYIDNSYLVHFVTAAETDFTRVHMGYNEARSWLVKKGEIIGLTPTQIRDKLNLLETPTHVSKAVVPKGVSISRGITNYNEWSWHSAGERIEGQVQYRIESEVKAEWFSQMKEIGEVFE